MPSYTNYAWHNISIDYIGINNNITSEDMMNTALKQILESMTDKAGARFLLELITHPNQPIHATQLRYLHSLPLLDRPEYKPDVNNQTYKSSKSNLANPFDETSVRYCDQQTITEIKQRLNKLLAMKDQAKEWNDYGRLEEIYDEEQILVDYLKKAFNRNGQPRYLRNKSKDDYSYVKKNLSRIISRIRQLDPAQAEMIEKHLKTGLRFVWK